MKIINYEVEATQIEISKFIQEKNALLIFSLWNSPKLPRKTFTHSCHFITSFGCSMNIRSSLETKLEHFRNASLTAENENLSIV